MKTGPAKRQSAGRRACQQPLGGVTGGRGGRSAGKARCTELFCGRGSCYQAQDSLPVFCYHVLAGPFPSGRQTNLLAARLPACAAVARAAGCGQLSACNSIGIVRCACAADRLRMVRAAARLLAIVRARVMNRCTCCAGESLRVLEFKISFESCPFQTRY